MDISQMSLFASVLIVAVVIIRSLALHQLPKKTFLVLWMCVLCRLLIPFTIPSSLSFYTWLDRIKDIFKEKTSLHFPVSISGMANIENMSQATGVSAPTLFISPIIEMVWLIGMCVCGLFFIVVYIKCRREFNMSLPIPHGFASDWLSKHPLRHPVELRQSDRIKAPLTYGIFRPVILFPKDTDWTDDTQLRYVLAHEHTHIRHFDTLTKLVLTLAVCVHWFNPLVWVMYVLANRDIELSCDETVVRTCGETIKSAYALTLIGLEEKKGGFTPLVNHFSKNSIEERIVSIMKLKKTSFVGILFALVLVAGTMTFFATSSHAQTYEATYDAAMTHEEAADYEKFQTTLKDYRKFGLTFDGTDYYYKGKLVRFFVDNRSGEAGKFSGTVIDSDQGSYYLEAKRDAENHLTAIEEITTERADQISFWRG